MVWKGRLGILADFLEDFEDVDKVKFWRKSVDESAIGSAVFPGNAISFCHPPYTIKLRYFYIFPSTGRAVYK